jgi:hemerythrin-like domain-containing protein
MKITERLKVEHGVYLLQLRHLEALMAAQAGPEVLKAVVRAIATAEDQHSKLEDTLLYPQLAKVVGEEFAPLVEVKNDHRLLAELAGRASESGDPADVKAFIDLLRGHLEREIHNLFTLAEEVLSADLLNSMGNWQEEHIYREMGQPAPWERPGQP